MSESETVVPLSDNNFVDKRRRHDSLISYGHYRGRVLFENLLVNVVE